MSDDRLQSAIDTMARDLLAKLADVGIDSSYGLGWGDYPEIGEHDWNAVVDRVHEITDVHLPDKATFDAAYQFLSERAEP